MRPPAGIRELWALSIATLSACVALHAETVLWEYGQANAALDRGILVSRGDFQDARLVEVCRQALNSSKAPLIRLVILTEENSKFDLWLMSHETFEPWVRNYKGGLTTPMQAAEMIAVRGNAVLRIRDGLALRRLVVSGEDPLVIESEGSRFELLHLYFSWLPAYSLRVFARCDGTLTLSNSRTLYGILAKAFAAPPSTLAVRKDRWFDDGAFPVRFWFDLSEPPSSFSEYNMAPMVECMRLGAGPPDCHGYWVK